MQDTPHGGDLEPVVSEQAEPNAVEDQDFDGFDSLDAAADALADDDLPEDEQPEMEAEPEAESPEEPEAEAEDQESDQGDAIVELPGGETITVSEIAELRASGMRLADYTQKTTEASEMRKEAEALNAQYGERLQFAETTLQNIAGFVQSLIPPEPSIELAQQNPGEYTQAMALRNGAIAELKKLTAMNQAVQGQKSLASEEDMQAIRRNETDALVKAMPHLSDPAKLDAFEKAFQDTGKEFGFDEAQLAQVTDHRVKRLAHYARLGMQSERNRNNAKRRIAATPAKAKARSAPAQPLGQANNRQAMRRLSKSGSIHDAMEIDFD